jgi:hypothetical protein
MHVLILFVTKLHGWHCSTMFDMQREILKMISARSVYKLITPRGAQVHVIVCFEMLTGK